MTVCPFSFRGCLAEWSRSTEYVSAIRTILMKCFSTWMATAMAVFKAYGQTAEPTVIPVKGDAPTSLYGGGAASRDDCVRKQAGDSFHWKGSGQLTWKVQVERAGDYEVALNHAADPGAVGQHVQVSSGSSRVE